MTNLIPIISVIISICAVVITFFIFKKQQHNQSYNDIDLMYFEILKLGIEYPDMRNIQKVSQYHKLPVDDVFRIRYETYAFICWNLCETIFDRQKSKDGELKLTSTWIPVLLEENRMHQVWFSHNLRLFKKEFQDFVKGVVNSIEIIRINDLASKEFRAVMEMYSKEFPIEERKTTEQIETLLLRKVYTLFIAKHKYFDHIIGFAFVVFNHEPEFAFLDYMAIDPMFQRCGFGTILFNSIVEMQKQNSLGILFELEKPSLAKDDQERVARERRRQFYLRLGCHELKGIDYKLPSIDGEPLPMDLVFKPNASIRVLPAESIKALIITGYDKIHSDVPNRHELFKSYLSTINDQYFP